MTSKNLSEEQPKKILVVDDEQDITTVIKKGLESEGFIVETSTKPLEVLKSYKPGSFDLLLLDLRMPEINGFELYRKIRELDSKVKVCFITAFEIYFDEFRRVFPKIHVSCFVQKPITISKLAEIICAELARPLEQEDEPAITQVRHNDLDSKRL